MTSREKVQNYSPQLERRTDSLNLLIRGMRNGIYTEVSLTTLDFGNIEGRPLQPGLISYTYEALPFIDPERPVNRAKLKAHRPANPYERRRFLEQVKANSSNLTEAEERAARIALGDF